MYVSTRPVKIFVPPFVLDRTRGSYDRRDGSEFRVELLRWSVSLRVTVLRVSSFSRCDRTNSYSSSLRRVGFLGGLLVGSVHQRMETFKVFYIPDLDKIDPPVSGLGRISAEGDDRGEGPWDRGSW